MKISSEIEHPIDEPIPVEITLKGQALLRAIPGFFAASACRVSGEIETPDQAESQLRLELAEMVSLTTLQKAEHQSRDVPGQ